ncbi:hypothetical protein JCM11641_001149 [Rhodosporidiobolus odoratus]
MEDLLLETRDLLLNYQKNGPPSTKIVAASRRLQDAESSTDDLPSSASNLPLELLLLIADLVKPAQSFISEDEDLDAEIALAKEQNMRHLPSLMVLAQHLVRLLRPPLDPPIPNELDSRARLLLVFGRFSQMDVGSPSITEDACSNASSFCYHLLGNPPSIRLPLLRHLLSRSLPPFFKPHPKFNPSTGRVLSRPLGGQTGVQDWYEEPEGDATGWRKQPGLGGVVNLIIETLEPNEVEDLWPPLLPPVLSYLDDYESKSRIVGVRLLDKLLDRVDASLLRRTGVGKVFEKSLDSCFSTLSDPLTPQLHTHTHPVALKLLNIQHSPSALPSQHEAAEEARFNALCNLLSSSILHAWEFKGQNVALETIAARALPAILDALGANSIRYLQILVPHLCVLLTSTATAAGGTWSIETVEMMTEAARALESVVRNASPRIGRWRGRIVGAVAQTWVGLQEGDGVGKLKNKEEGAERLEALTEALKSVGRGLEEACGQKEVKLADRLRSMSSLFADLLPVSRTSTTVAV